VQSCKTCDCEQSENKRQMPSWRPEDGRRCQKPSIQKCTQSACGRSVAQYYVSPCLLVLLYGSVCSYWLLVVCCLLLVVVGCWETP
jgi:Flp pilus assembly protein TadB